MSNTETSTETSTETGIGGPVHPWHVHGPARATYVRHLVARNVTETLVVAGAALALFSLAWGFLLLAAAIASDVYARRAHNASWALAPVGQLAPQSHAPVPTPPAVAALHGLATFLLYVAAATVLARRGELGAFCTTVIAAVNLTAADVHLARRRRTGTAAALLSASFSLAGAAACVVLLLTLGQLDLSTCLSYCAAAGALAATCLLLYGGWRLVLRLRHTDGMGARG